MKTFGKYCKPYWPYFVLAPLLMIVEVSGDVLMPAKLADIINIGAAQKNIPYILQTGGVMLLFIVCMVAGGVGGSWFATKASVGFAADLRKDLFQHIEDFSFSDIDRFSSGSLITRLINDVTQLQNVVMMLLRMAFRAPFMFLGALVMAFMMDWRLTLIICAVIPVMAAIIAIILKFAMPRFTVLQKKLDRLNETLEEALNGVRVVKSFVREDYQEDRFQKANENLKSASIKAYKLVIIQMPLMTLLMNLTTLAVVWFGGQRILGGTFQVGNLTAFTNYIVQILMSLMMLTGLLLQLSRASACAQRIKEILNTVPAIHDENADKSDLVVTKGKVEFRHVSFRYYKNSEEPVLNNLNLVIQPGQTVGFIGSTGCGKTTLVSLIPRLYDTDDGEILVDDTDVRDYSLFHLREGVGMVLQKNVLFSGTVAENLRWGNEEATDDELDAAAESAQALRFIHEMKDGMNTFLGQGGSNVSGGQKQRLCIARALLKHPRILILDDSTSAVDMATEAHIRRSFSNELRDTTKIIIAQRITSVQDADVIFVMDEGKIVGSGTHDELMDSCETYREIFESQIKKEVSHS